MIAAYPNFPLESQKLYWLISGELSQDSGFFSQWKLIIVGFRDRADRSEKYLTTKDKLEWDYGPEFASLMEVWKCLLKAELKHDLGRNTLYRCMSYKRFNVYLESVHFTQCYVPCRKNTLAYETRGKIRVALFIITPSHTLGAFVLNYLHIPGLCMVGLISPQRDLQSSREHSKNPVKL